MAAEFIPLDPTESFRFHCGPAVPCFNACCHELVQMLTPLDIIRLKRHLDVTSTTFLNRYTITYAGPETGLPVVSLVPAPGTGGACPFVGEGGCRVYPARPTSCRTYPVARAIGRCRQTGKLTENFALIREPHCMGFSEGPEQRVHQWLEAQAALPDFAVIDQLLDIIQLKNRLHPGPIPADDRARCHTALYDMDRFRNFLLEAPTIAGVPIPERLWAAERSDDMELLPLAMGWVRRFLFERGAS